jgi:hypothetical protein
MTVIINAIPGGIKSLASGCLDRELGDRIYCSLKRKLAEKAVAEFRPAYIQVTDGNDQWAGCAVTWANGGMLGTSLDPPQPLYGLFAVLKWVETWKASADFDLWMAHVVKVLKPINAAAWYDRDAMSLKYGLRSEDMHGG